MKTEYDLKKIPVIQKDGKRLMLDSLGDEYEVIDIGFECLLESCFVRNDLIWVVDQNANFGLINLHGDMVLAPKYTYMGKFQGNKALVYNGENYQYGIINDEGKEISLGGKTWGVIDGREYVDGNDQVIFKEPYCLNDHSNDKLLSVWGKNGKWGFVDNDRKLVVDYEYDEVKRFSDGLAAVRKLNKWGFIDETGKLVIDCQYYSAESFNNGLAVVTRVDGLYRASDNSDVIIIDKNNNPVLVFKNKVLRSASERAVLVSNFYGGQVLLYDLQDHEKREISSKYVVPKTRTKVNSHGFKVFDTFKLDIMVDGEKYSYSIDSQEQAFMIIDYMYEAIDEASRIASQKIFTKINQRMSQTD